MTIEAADLQSKQHAAEQSEQRAIEKENEEEGKNNAEFSIIFYFYAAISTDYL
jgi:hypothetical protein